LSFASSEWSSTAKMSPDGKLILWPYSPPLITVGSFLAAGSTLATTPYALGMYWLDELVQLGLPYASLTSYSGAVIAPNADSVLFAVMERGGVPLDKLGNLVDLTGVTGPYVLLASSSRPPCHHTLLVYADRSSWPLTAYSYLVVRGAAFRSTCAIKTAMVEFWQWWYTSQTASDMATSLSFVIPPAQIRESHGIDSTLSISMFCRDSLVAPTQRTEQSLGIGTSIANSLYALYPIVYNNLDSTNGTIDYQEATSDNALQSLIYNEVDFATTCQFVMSPEPLLEALDSGEVMQFPLFSSRYQIIYSLPTLKSAKRATNELILDWAVLSDIFSGVITSWNDPKIGALNPSLVAAGLLPKLNITRVFATTGEREGDRLVLETVRHWSTFTSSAFNLTRDNQGRILAYMDQLWISSIPNLLSVTTVDKVQATVLNKPGAFGVVVVDRLLELDTQRIRLLRDPGGTPLADSSTASYRCQLDTFDNVYNRFHVTLKPSYNILQQLHKSLSCGMLFCWYNSYIYQRMKDVGHLQLVNN
jgi:ABC-type phosphate transport system substrate-binding protein